VQLVLRALSVLLLFRILLTRAIGCSVLLVQRRAQSLSSPPVRRCIGVTRKGATMSDGVIPKVCHDFPKFAAHCESDRKVIEALGSKGDCEACSVCKFYEVFGRAAGI
jgi:hypothetical protein